MPERKSLILDIIVQEHIKTGAPVGSSLVVDKYRLKVSPATVRNDMMELESEGYIIQPHTSAGRIPTEKAYLKYLEQIDEGKLKQEEKKELDKALYKRDESGFKQTAKVLAKLSNNAVFWAFEKNNLYYTGISNLFAQPEFTNSDLIFNISAVIDRIDEIIDDIYLSIKPEPQIMLGRNNPFSHDCGSVITKYHLNKNIGLIGIIGPIRMDYKKSLSLVSYIREKISKQ
jgi:heat-inducible transcriptional repressor